MVHVGAPSALGGSGAFADPGREFYVALIVNSGIGTPFGDLRIARIGGAALASANRRPHMTFMPAVIPQAPPLRTSA